MREYAYLFVKDGHVYYVYASCRAKAIKKYLKEQGLSEMPKGITITQVNN